MHAIQDTSRLAFSDIKPELGERQQKVLEVVHLHGPMTNSEIAEKLDWSINTVTPRTNELVKRRKLVQFEKRYCSITGRLAIVWGEVTDRLF